MEFEAFQLLALPLLLTLQKFVADWTELSEVALYLSIIQVL